jgi:hypothetical protein
MKAQICREVKDGKAFYDFVCEGCGAEGNLGIPTDLAGTFGCPEQCGATYYQWTYEGKIQLTCVVCPVFESQPQRAHDGDTKLPSPSDASANIKE